jgi:hypothetical protein
MASVGPVAALTETRVVPAHNGPLPRDGMPQCEMLFSLAITTYSPSRRLNSAIPRADVNAVTTLFPVGLSTSTKTDPMGELDCQEIALTLRTLGPGSANAIIATKTAIITFMTLTIPRGDLLPHIYPNAKRSQIGPCGMRVYNSMIFNSRH